RVEILKALYRGARTLILDEPTAVLSPPEVSELWDVLRQMRSRGETIVLITHKLDEVMSISDTVTVMRHGRTISRLRTAETTPQEIAREMVGRDVQLASDMRRDAIHGDEAWAAATSRDATAGESLGSAAFPLPALEVRGLVVGNARRADAVRDVSFSISPGEILGIAGVEGNGQTELIEAIAGLRRVQ